MFLSSVFRWGEWCCVDVCAAGCVTAWLARACSCVFRWSVRGVRLG